MRTLCPNFDREDGLETVLEVPMPEELFCSDNNKSGAWRSVKSSLLRSSPDNSSSLATLFGGRDAQIQMLLGNAQIQMLLGIVGAPSIPLPVSSDHEEIDHPISKLIKNQSIVSKYTRLNLFFENKSVRLDCLFAFDLVFHRLASKTIASQIFLSDKFLILLLLCFWVSIGISHGEVHSKAIHRSSWRRDGIGCGREHVRDGKGEDGSD